jgi:methylenetetrahydrofolate dehydrogenase (NADP+) / methenyltetrahydrofolate cyclohydrolase
MKIDGRVIASEIYDRLTNRVGELKKRNITPQLAVILVGNDEGSISYIKQKKKYAEKIGAVVTVFPFDANISEEKILSLIDDLNKDNSIHGIIVQLPLPQKLTTTTIVNEVTPQKDIDGFHKQSPFEVPVALAVIRLLNEMYNKIDTIQKATLTQWLTTQNVTLLGKGKTAGEPIKNYLHKLDVPFSLIDSHTENPSILLKNAYIVISSVGKSILKKEQLREGVILIGVGLHKDEEGKLIGDYDEKEIETYASFYTSTPGGVGPVNVAMLLENLITAAEQQNS